MSAPAALELRDIVKRYGSAVAVDGVSLDVAPGEVHALVGENGAGKSTLIKVLGGAIAADAGTIAVSGAPVVFRSPADAIAAGIGIIPQEPQLVPQLSVMESIVLGREPTRGRTSLIDRAQMRRTARAALEAVGEEIDLAAPVGRLAVARRQIVEIATATSRGARILAFDEPTAALSDREVSGLLGLIGRLRSEGAAIIYISHRLDEVFSIADRITVLRDGRAIATEPRGALDRERIIRLMVGREVAAPSPRAPGSAGGELLRLERVSGARVADVDLSLACGEILGIAGLVGAGRTELARLIFGADRRSSGRIMLEGREVEPRSPREAIDLGIGLLTEDRDRLGVIAPMNVRENVTLAGLARLRRGLFISRAQERRATSAHAARLRIKMPSMDAPVFSLSGGNRQKVVLARWLETRSRVLIFDEPTAGVDVGARDEIHRLMIELAAEGRGIIVVSSDLDEILAISDRIAVMREGRIRGTLSRDEATRPAVMAMATGAHVFGATA